MHDVMHVVVYALASGELEDSLVALRHRAPREMLARQCAIRRRKPLAQCRIARKCLQRYGSFLHIVG
jgi:hypothetical protein